MAKKGVLDIGRVRTLRTSIHALALLQQELRRVVEQRRAEDKPPKALGTITREINVQWKDMKEFIDRTKVLCSSRTVYGIANYARRPDLAEKICAIANEIPDRFIGVASAMPEAIDCAFDLEEAWIACAETLNQEEFANAFHPYGNTVLGAIRHAHTALTDLENPDVREAIRTIITDASYTNRIASATATNADRRREKSARLASLVATLKTTYKLHQKVAEALGVYRTTLTAACKGTAGEETINELIVKATALVGTSAEAQQGAPTPAPIPPAPKCAVQQPPSAIEILEQFGGETSPLGVRFVLGPDSFREIEIGQIDAFIAFGLRQLELARIVLNVSAQIKDEATRKRIRETFGKHVEETELAIRIHTARFPNRLTKLHQGEREAWEAFDKTNPRKGKAQQ